MIQQIRSVILMIFAAPFVIGCGAGLDPHEQLANKMMSSMDEIANTFSTIKDEPTAVAAKSKLEAAMTAMNALVEQGKKIGDPSPELKAKLEAKMQEKAKAMQEKMMEFAKVAMTNPKVMEIIGPIMQKMSTQK